MAVTLEGVCYGKGAPLRIERGDVISVEVMEHPEFNRQGIMVLPNGFIQYPALGSIKAAGYTLDQLADTIESALNEDFVVNPYVTVYVNKFYNQSINIFGGVNVPGRYQVFEPIELFDAIALAGGFINIKKTTKIFIVRSDGKVEEINMRRMVRKDKLKGLEQAVLYPDDSVIVKHKDFNWSKLTFLVTLTHAVAYILVMLV